MSGELIADLPFDERPRERMKLHGASTLSDAELIAILIGSGTKGRSAIQVARALLENGLSALARRDWPSGKLASGVGPAKACRIAAALEIGRRLGALCDGEREPIRDAGAIARPLIARYSHYMQERLGALFLDSKNRIIREREIYVGTLNATTVSTRDVLRLALEENAGGLVAFHNHPSGDPSPSAEDIAFTRKLNEACRLFGIELVDHLIIGENRFVSLRNRGVI
ncbi:MAG TPA: DNA repair protein RadC [Thermoanaerobaculia bacterium]|nr:DNA repair protein RadC [Thermoanaerobaculia bacterium]